MPPRFILLSIASLVIVHGAGAMGNPKNAPDPQSPPTITGAAQEGSTLSASDGTWGGAGAQLQFAYQWRRCVSSESCTNVAGATAKTYTPAAADVTYRLRVVVTATNKFGSDSSNSALTDVVAPRPLTSGGSTPPPPSTGSAPANTSAPSISGTAVVGSNFTTSTGGWSGTTPITYSYQWRRCDSAGSNCVDVAGATSASFALTSTDAGKTLRVRVSGQNAYGSSSATSAATAVVASGSGSTLLPGPSGTIGFTGDWETGNISQWTWGAQCANYGLQSSGGIARGNLYVINSPVSQGVFGSRFDLPASSDRTACEVLRKRTLNLGSDEYYGLDIRFPSDWQEPSPHGWGMAIGQFNYQGIWGPPLGLFAHRDHVKLVMQSGWCRDVYSSNPGCTYSSGIGGNVPITYAIPSSRFSAGTWHQLIVHVRWTNTSAGVLEAWHRRRGESSWVKTASQTGYPTVQWSDTYSVTSDHTTTDKIGAYRGPASFTTSIWHDAFVIGTTFDTVAQQLDAGGKATVTPSEAPPPAPSAAPPAPALGPAESPDQASTPEATAPSPEAAPATSAGSNSAVAATPANRQISRGKIRAASRVIIRFRSGFAGRAIGLRRTTDTPRPKSMVILYHRAPSGWRVFAVQPLTRHGAFRIDKRPWSRRSTLRFRAVVAVGGTTRISSGILTLRRVGPGRSSFAQARPAQR